MHAHTTTKIHFDEHVTDTILGKALVVIAHAADDSDLRADGRFFVVEESYHLVWIEDIQDLAKELAKLCEGVCGFEISGTVDTSESAGEYKDFEFRFDGKKLKRSESPWYLLECSTLSWDDDYDAFCDDFEEGAYSREFFDRLKTEGEWYRESGVYDETAIWLSGVHMSKPKVIKF